MVDGIGPGAGLSLPRATQLLAWVPSGASRSVLTMMRPFRDRPLFMLGFGLLATALPAMALLRQTAQSAAVSNVYAFQYLLYLPAGYGSDATARWPLLVFLHGAGERGTNVEAVAVNGPPLLIERGRDFPCVVVSPQCSGASWNSAALEAFIRDLVSQYRIDPDRVYLTGLSMGGYATWDLAARTPGLYAAAVPICGGGTPSLAYQLRNLPLWAFHGALDATVPVARTLEMIDAIRQAGGNPRLTIYPDLGHDAWTITYANDALYAWLFAQSRARLPGSLAAPTIALEPQGWRVTAGQNAIFTLAADGNPAPAYQWQRRPAGSTAWENLNEGGSYRGATSATLTVSAITAAMSGDQFRCVITNSLGSAATSAVALAVSGAGATPFQYPVSVSGDSAGNLYVADTSGNTIDKITPAGLVSTLAGTTGVAGAQDGAGSSALFNQPGGVAVDDAGNLYVADTGNATIRKITPNGTVSTLAGSPTSRGNQDGSGSAASFSSPAGVAVDGAGNVYVADAFNATIRKITAAGAVSTLAGSAMNRGDADGTGPAAQFNYPNGVAVNAAGNLYVADTYNDTIRQITPAGVVTTLAGSAGISGAVDLAGRSALFNQPCGIAVDSAGNLYVADTGNGTIRRITPGGAVSTVAGMAGVAGLGDGAGTSALFNQPHGLWLDAAGNLYVADTGNAVLRRIATDGTVTTPALSVTPAPVPASPPTGGTTTPPAGTGTASASGGGAAPSWFVGLLTLLMATRRIVRLREARAIAVKTGPVQPRHCPPWVTGRFRPLP
jgi:pimeloyl-ACP methyl ester carboxylesterase/sugar lactone lactonase YvrE